MSRLLGVVFIYAAMLLAWTAAASFMLVAPGRFGNLVHESLNLFPEILPGDWGKKLAVRLTGIGLLAFDIRFVFRIVAYVHQSG
jgi:hypothetical protein